MRTLLALVLLAVVAAALLLFLRDDADVAPLASTDRHQAQDTPAQLTSESAPGLSGLTEEQRARLKKPAARREPVLARVLRGGKPVPGRKVRITGTRLDKVASHVFEAVTDEHGEVRHALPRGIYKIGLVAPPPLGQVSPLNLRASLSRSQDVLTHKGPLKAPVLIELPPGRVVVRVVDGDGKPLEDARVRVALHHATTDSKGEAHLGELRAERVAYAVHKAGYAPADPRIALRELDVAAEGVTRLEVTMVLAGALRLQFRDEQGAVVWRAHTLRPRVRPLDWQGPILTYPRSLPFEFLARNPQLVQPGAHLEAVLPGRYRVVIEDERYEKAVRVAIRAQPYDPVEPQIARVVAERTTTLTFVVRPRARVDLRVFDADGKVTQHKVSLRVSRRRAGAGAVERYVTEGASDIWYRYPRFQGHLPPGTYDVEIARKGTLERHELVVAREDVSRGFRPRAR